MMPLNCPEGLVLQTNPRPARRHASRRTRVGGRDVDVYLAAATKRPSVDLLGPRPRGETAAKHRADHCACQPVGSESAAQWNASCPPSSARPTWRVTYR